MPGQRGAWPGGWAQLLPEIGRRAAIGVMFLLFLLAVVIADALHATALAGFGFAAGSAVAAGCTRRRELLMVVTTPPAIFLAAAACGELITMHLDHVAPSAGLVGANTFLTLSATAPWLFGGVVGAVLIAGFRGLPQCVSDLRAELAGRTARDPYLSQRAGGRPGAPMP